MHRLTRSSVDEEHLTQIPDQLNSQQNRHLNINIRIVAHRKAYDILSLCINIKQNWCKPDRHIVTLL